MDATRTDCPRRILMVEDDAEISRMSIGVLSENGFWASAVTCAKEMDAVMDREKVDLLLLDVSLPGEDGFSICRRLRATTALPIILVTGRREQTDRIVGLEIGADDYVVKPFDSRELVARIRALLRRANAVHSASRGRAPILHFDGWRIDPVMRQLHAPSGIRVAMTSVEIDLLLAFCRHAGQVLSREELLELVHGAGVGPIERSIDVHVSRIRQKIELDPRDPLLIKTVRLGGYLFTPVVEEA